MSASEYDEVADEDLDRLHESLEGVCEEYGQGEWEVEYSVSPAEHSEAPSAHQTFTV